MRNREEEGIVRMCLINACLIVVLLLLGLVFAAGMRQMRVSEENREQCKKFNIPLGACEHMQFIEMYNIDSAPEEKDIENNM